MPEPTEASTSMLDLLEQHLRSGTPLGDAAALTAPDGRGPDGRGPGVPDGALTPVAAADVRAALRAVGDDADTRGLALTGFAVQGDLDLSGMRGLPRLSFSHCRFDGSLSLDLAAALSLTLESVAIEDVSASGLSLDGDLLVVACSLDGVLDLSGARVRGRVDVLDTLAHDLRADKLVVESNMSWFGSEAASFTFNSGECRGPSSDTANNNIALTRADYVDVSAAVFTCSVGIGFAGWANGERPAGRLGLLRLDGAQCSGDLEIAGAVGEAIEARRLQVDGDLGLPSAESAPAGIDLTGARIGTLQLPSDRAGSTVLAARADGTRSWTVGTVELRAPGAGGFAVPSSSSDVKGFDALVAWLPRFDEHAARSPRWTGRQHPFFAQPWLAVAAALDGEGRHREARRLRIEGTDRQKRAAASPIGQVGRLVTWGAIGHGYASFRAAWLLLLTYAVSVVVVATATAAFEPTGADNPPGLWSPLYALDIVISPVGTGQSDLWGADVLWLAVVLWALKFVSWMLAGLFVSGVSGLANRPSTS